MPCAHMWLQRSVRHLAPKEDDHERAARHLRIMQQAQAWADACEQDHAAASDSCGPAGDLFFVLQAHRHQLFSGVYGKHIEEGLWRARFPVSVFGWTHPEFV